MVALGDDVVIAAMARPDRLQRHGRSGLAADHAWGPGLVEGSLTGLLVLAGIPSASAVLSTLAFRAASYWLRG